jgi:hypothetical protein
VVHILIFTSFGIMMGKKLIVMFYVDDHHRQHWKKDGLAQDLVKREIEDDRFGVDWTLFSFNKEGVFFVSNTIHRKMLQFFGMAKNTKLVVDKVDPTTYNKMVNKLISLINIRPYVHFLNFYNSSILNWPQLLHLSAIKQIFRYLKGTTYYEIL